MHEETIVKIGSKKQEGVVEQAPVIIKPVVEYLVKDSR
jgi:hypothetical protein